MKDTEKFSGFYIYIQINQNNTNYNWIKKKEMEMSFNVINRSMLMTACDLGAVTRPWKISKQVWAFHYPFIQAANVLITDSNY